MNDPSLAAPASNTVVQTASSDEEKISGRKKREGETTMANVVENIFANDSDPTICIRSFVDPVGSVWSNAADVARACGYSTAARAIAAAARKGISETLNEGGELYVSRATAMQIATRKGCHRFLQWLITRLEQIEREARDKPATEQTPETAAIQTVAPRTADDAVVGDRLLASVDAFMGSVTKQIELQALATSYKIARNSGVPYDLQNDLQRKLADKIVELTHGDRAEEYVSAGQILRERGLPAHSVDRLECEFGKDLMLVARRENIELPPMNLNRHHGIVDGCCRVWHRERHAELVNDVLESFMKRPIWAEHVSARAQTRMRADLLDCEGRGRRRRSLR